MLVMLIVYDWVLMLSLKNDYYIGFDLLWKFCNILFKNKDSVILMFDVNDLEIMMWFRVLLIIIEIYEELWVLDLIKCSGIQLNKLVFSWLVIEGVKWIDLIYEIDEW